MFMDLELESPTLPRSLVVAKQRIESLLETWLPPEQTNSSLTKAMRYSALSGGKRLRSALIYALQAPLEIPLQACDHVAAAIECIHASSLIHDDLPALDDDDLRRGVPANHIAFGEANAILAGDALMNFAYECLLKLPDTHASATVKMEMLRRMTAAIGEHGMIGGQAREFHDGPKNEAQILQLYAQKTGALLGAGLQMAACASPNNSPHLQRTLQTMSYHMGLAFQIHDDILDIESSSEQLGKPQFSDQDEDKQTLIALIGLDKAKILRTHHANATQSALEKLDLDVTQLNEIIHFIFQRQF